MNTRCTNRAVHIREQTKQADEKKIRHKRKRSTNNGTSGSGNFEDETFGNNDENSIGENDSGNEVLHETNAYSVENDIGENDADNEVGEDDDASDDGSISSASSAAFRRYQEDARFVNYITCASRQFIDVQFILTGTSKWNLKMKRRKLQIKIVQCFVWNWAISAFLIP